MLYEHKQRQDGRIDGFQVRKQGSKSVALVLKCASLLISVKMI